MNLRSLVMMVLLLAAGSTVAGADRRSQAPAARMQTVRVREGTELVAALSPDGKRVAFILLGQVWLVDRAGGRAITVTNMAEDFRENRAVAWAPDSRRLAVASLFELGTALHVIDLASHQVTLVSERDDMRCFSPAWSPDGRTITDCGTMADAVLSWNAVPNPVLWEVPLDGRSVPTQVAALPRFTATPAYSPDGRKLAYSGPVTDWELEPSAESDLWERDLATGKERQLTTDQTLDAYPAYSPDGRWIAFLSERSGSRQVWLMPRTGGEPRPLTRDAEDVYLGPVTWLPDSQGLVYTAAGKIQVISLDGRGSEIEFVADLPVQRSRVLRRLKLPEPGEQRRARGIVTPELSPDGTRIAFAALGDLWVATVQGGKPHQVTRTQAEEVQPCWSPDGKRLAYLAAAPGEEQELRVVEIGRPESDRRVPVTLARVNGFLDGRFTWSPNGECLAYLDGTHISRIDLNSGVKHVLPRPADDQGRAVLLGWPHPGEVAFSTISSKDRKTHRWRARLDRDQAEEWRVLSDEVRSSVWTVDLTRTAYSVRGVGYYVSVAGTSPPVRIADHSPRFYSWSQNGRFLAYISGDRVRLLDTARGSTRTLSVGPRYQVPKPPPPLLIRNVRIIDGTGAAPSALVDLLVADGRVRQIASPGRVRVPKSTGTLDGAGRTLLPGLFNLHVHHSPSHPATTAAHPYFGVLAIREMGMDAEWMQSQRERSEAGEFPAARIFHTGGTIIARKNSSGTQSRAVDATDAQAVADTVRKVATVGADWIKPYLRDPLLDARVIEAAHRLGLPVTSHFVFLSSLARGIDGKEHASLWNRGWTAIYREDLLAALQAADILVTPTLVTTPVHGLAGRSPLLPLDSGFLEDPALAVLYPPRMLEDERRRLQVPVLEDAFQRRSRNLRWDLENMRRLHQRGVRIATGTDVGPPWLEFGIHLEMELLVKAGFTLLEAIRAATLEGARGLGVEDQLGTIAVGKLADFIIVDGNPAVDIRDTRRIQWVVLGGRPYTRPEILEHVRRAAAR